MATRKMRIRARSLDGGITELMVLVKHPMETGLRKHKETKKAIAAHYIKTMRVEHNGREVAVADLGTAVAANPIMGFGLKNAKSGDKVKVSWKDNKGESGAMEQAISL